MAPRPLAVPIPVSWRRLPPPRRGPWGIPTRPVSCGGGPTRGPRPGQAHSAGGGGRRRRPRPGPDEPPVGPSPPPGCPGQPGKAAALDTPTDGGGTVGRAPRPRVARLTASRARVTQRAAAPLGALHAVAKRLLPQSVPWSTTAGGAQGTILHAGVTPARALVRHQAGQEVGSSPFFPVK